MALIHWEPVAELSSIQNEMNRLFNSFFDQPRGTGTTEAPRSRWVPPMDLLESANHFLLTLDLPGLDERDVALTFQGGVLTISGQRALAHDAHEGYLLLERPYGAFSRSLTLPGGVDPDRLQAHFDAGVLSVIIPKPERSKPRKVNIGSAAGTEPAPIEGAETTEQRDPALTG
jgi:HSP20 family protein